MNNKLGICFDCIKWQVATKSNSVQYKCLICNKENILVIENFYAYSTKNKAIALEILKLIEKVSIKSKETVGNLETFVLDPKLFLNRNIDILYGDYGTEYIFSVVEDEQEKCEHCNGSGVGLDFLTLQEVPNGCTKCNGLGYRLP